MYDRIPEREIADLLERVLGRGDWRVALVAQSSNYVYKCDGTDMTVAVRTPRLHSTSPSHYWRQMNELFDLSLPPTAAHLRSVAAAINEAGLTCPQVLAATTVESRPVVIMTWVAGDSWSPDLFPPSRAVHRSLGIFLAKMHERRHGGFGCVGRPLRPPSQYYRAAVESARKTVTTAWSDAAGHLLSVMDDSDPAAVATSFALVMPDISGNQFVFDREGLAAVVDLDSYVVGPVELELTIVEWCLVEHAAFADGYESVRPLPKFAPFRAFHRATMLVNEEALAGDVQQLLEENAFFS